MVSNPDSLVEYIRALDRRYEKLSEAVRTHHYQKLEHALPGTIDGFDRELWASVAELADAPDSNSGSQ